MFQKIVFSLVFTLHFYLYSEEPDGRLRVRGLDALEAANQLEMINHQEDALFQSILEIEKKGKRPRPKLIDSRECEEWETYDLNAGKVLLQCKRMEVSVCIEANSQTKFFEKTQTLSQLPGIKVNFGTLKSEEYIACDILKK